MLEPNFLLNGQHQRVLPTIPSQLNLMSGVRSEGTFSVSVILFLINVLNSLELLIYVINKLCLDPRPSSVSQQEFIKYLLSAKHCVGQLA